jgi:hypothetical protein
MIVKSQEQKIYFGRRLMGFAPKFLKIDTLGAKQTLGAKPLYP